MRIPRKQHMKGRAEFARVRQQGRAAVGRFVIVSTLEDPSLASLHPGYITTRRIGKAHERNLLRRRFRAIVSAHAAGIEPLARYLVTIARPGSARADYAQLEADWLKQAARLRLFPKEGGAA
jgi:ribonuclease P protein component